jgi:hypothetical protein
MKLKELENYFYSFENEPEELKKMSNKEKNYTK